MKIYFTTKLKKYLNSCRCFFLFFCGNPSKQVANYDQLYGQRGYKTVDIRQHNFFNVMLPLYFFSHHVFWFFFLRRSREKISLTYKHNQPFIYIFSLFLSLSKFFSFLCLPFTCTQKKIWASYRFFWFEGEQQQEENYYIFIFEHRTHRTPKKIVSTQAKLLYNTRQIQKNSVRTKNAFCIFFLPSQKTREFNS